MARMVGEGKTGSSRYGEMLSVYGASRVALCMKICGSRNGREALAGRSGINSGLLLKWARMVGRYSTAPERYVQLLQVSDVTAVKIARLRDAEFMMARTMERSSGMK